MKVSDIAIWHEWTHNLATVFSDSNNLWLHIVLHTALTFMPVFLGFMLLIIALRLLRVIHKKIKSKNINPIIHKAIGIPNSFISFIIRFSLKDQVFLCLISLSILPLTYASLELPKRIINEAINPDNFLQKGFYPSIKQSDYLLMLCSLFLAVIILSAIIKYIINFYKGSVAERLIKLLRNVTYKKYIRLSRHNDESVIPIIIQEVEPIGGFSGESFSVPILQGGIALTIITFMMIQNFALGAAAIALLPVQIIIVPYFQRKINQLVRERVLLTRQLSDDISKSADHNRFLIKQHFNELQNLRLKIFKKKYLMKSISNLLMNLTPFFFYTIGGYLVIEGQLSLGALIASLASYKDLASSIRDLFAYYQRMQDVKIRYSEVFKYTSNTN